MIKTYLHEAYLRRKTEPELKTIEIKHTRTLSIVAEIAKTQQNI